MFDSIISVSQTALEVIIENIWNIAAAVLVFLLFLMLRKKIAKYIGKLLEKLFSSKPAIGAGIRNAIIDPLSTFFLFLGMYAACIIMGTPASVMAFLTKLFRVSIIFLIAWSFTNFTPVATALVMNANAKTDHKINAAAVKLVANVFKIIILSLAMVIVISELGYDISGLITGLGLGGLTFSLAAQSTATNLFSGFAIVSDKPFDVGDYVSTPSVEGTIEDITMRSTRVRTVADTVMVVPNSKLIDEPITNWSRMNKRFVDMTIGLTYDTKTEVIKKCVSDIEQMLKAHEDVDDSRIVVTFSEFADSSLNIRIIYFTRTTVYDEFLYVKQDINYRIREIVEKNGAEFAFPTTTVCMDK